MGWKLIDRPKTQKITKKLAETYASMDPAPHDRPLSERRLLVYERMVRSGQFRPVTWASAKCIDTGETYRVNGKHTSVMLSGMEDCPDFYVTIEEYECQTLEDVAKLYATFDSAMQQRNANDIYLSFAATVPELDDASQKVIKLSPSAICMALYGEQETYEKTPAERAETILDNVKFIIWASDVLTGDGGGKLAHISRMPVVSAMFMSFQKSMTAANEFWRAVRNETGERPELPDRKIAKYLLTTGSRKDSRSAKTSSSRREIYVKCLHAWNAWRRGETTSLAYYADAKIPAIV